MKKRALIVNDTRLDYHQGCEIVIERLLGLCAESNIDVLMALRVDRGFRRRFIQLVSQCDLLIINGEGTMHDDAAAAIEIAWAGEFAHGLGIPVFLINTVWQSNSEVNRLLACCTGIYARESLSAKEVEYCGSACLVAPDLTLAARNLLSGVRGASSESPVVVIDDVRVDVSLALRNFAEDNGYPFVVMGRPAWQSGRLGRFCSFLKSLNPVITKASAIDEICAALVSSEVVVTGRFHGACLSILAGRPFVALASNTHKIEGLIRDAGLGDGAIILGDEALLAGGASKLFDAVDSMRNRIKDEGFKSEFKRACAAYVLRSQQAIGEMFERISNGVAGLN